MAKRAPTAYFLFAAEQRSAVHQEISEANGGKASVALVGKAIGEKWQQLTDEERQHYKDLAAQKAAEFKEHAAPADDAEGADLDPGEGTGAVVASNIPPFGLPTSLVKKIASMDPEFQRISGDGNKAMAKAASLFLEWLAVKALAHATGNKRKNFKFADIEAVAKKDRRLIDMDLPTFFQEDAAFAEIHERLDEESQARQAKRKPNADLTGEELARQKLRPLTDFFPANANGQGQ